MYGYEWTAFRKHMFFFVLLFFSLELSESNKTTVFLILTYMYFL